MRAGGDGLSKIDLMARPGKPKVTQGTLYPEDWPFSAAHAPEVGSIEAYDPQRRDKPADPLAPFVESIKVLRLASAPRRRTAAKSNRRREGR